MRKKNNLGYLVVFLAGLLILTGCQKNNTETASESPLAYPTQEKPYKFDPSALKFHKNTDTKSISDQNGKRPASSK